MIKEITLYTNGDSRDLATWSNVPYLFAGALERRGLKVNRVDISADSRLLRVYDSFFYRLFRRLLGRKASPTFYKSPFHRWIINRRLRRAAATYSDSDVNLFLSYLFVNKYSDRPNVVWCDWTDRVVIERMGREPQWYERWSLEREDEVVRMADERYTMFPKCREHLEELYGVEFRYLDRNVVNTVYEGEVDRQANARRRWESQDILFIGNHRYLGAARELIGAFRKIRPSYPELRLQIIGMTGEELGLSGVEEDVCCHGYLNKSIAGDREMYYDLLLNARMMVNTASQWGGYSSTVEAMYYGCPVIVSSYEDFVENFGENIGFGIYHCDDNLVTELKSVLDMDFESYKRMSECGAQTVADYTWDNYVNAFLKDLECQLNKVCRKSGI